MIGNAVSDNGVKCLDNTTSAVTTLTEYIVEISVMQIGKNTLPVSSVKIIGSDIYDRVMAAMN
jgi:hypothetical protein